MRLQQAPQRGLLVRRGVPPDQHQPGHAEHLRPRPADEPSAVQRADRQQYQDEQRREADREPDAPGVGPGLAADAGLFAGRRQEQPACDVHRHEPSAGYQGDQHEHDPDSRDVEAPPRGHAGRHAAAQPVSRVTAQRTAAAAPLSQPERAAARMVAAPVVAVPMVAMPALRILHSPIIAQSRGTAIREIPDATLRPGGRDQGYCGDLPDVLAWPAEPSLSHEHQHREPRSTHHRV